jgi:transcriptional regulator with XRE-family HTH domain
MNLDDYIAEREAREPELRAAREALEHEYAYHRAVIEARLAAGISQRELAARMGKQQPAIARLEGGKHPPGLDMLYALAKAVGGTFTISPTSPLTFKPAARRSETTAGREQQITGGAVRTKRTRKIG